MKDSGVVVRAVFQDIIHPFFVAGIAVKSDVVFGQHRSIVPRQGGVFARGATKEEQGDRQKK